MAGVVFFAKEEDRRTSSRRGGNSAETAETHGGETGEEPATTGTGDEQETEAAPATRRAIQQRARRSSPAGCGGCHTLEAAGSTGHVGPNLDEAQPARARGRARHERHGRDAVLHGSLNEQQIHDVAAYVVESTQG